MQQVLKPRVNEIVEWQGEAAQNGGTRKLQDLRERKSKGH